MCFKLLTLGSSKKAFTRIVQSIFIIVTVNRRGGKLAIVCKTPSKLCVIEVRLEREADSRLNSFLDRNELEPTSGSVPRLCENSDHLLV